jgi:hypothetical protein
MISHDPACPSRKAANSPSMTWPIRLAISTNFAPDIPAPLSESVYGFGRIAIDALGASNCPRRSCGILAEQFDELTQRDRETAVLIAVANRDAFHVVALTALMTARLRGSFASLRMTVGRITPALAGGGRADSAEGSTAPRFGA